MAYQNGGFNQRDEVEDKAESHCGLHDLAQQVAPLAKQQQGVEQPHAVAHHRDSKPD